ncbi:MAG: very short patch repair endonuclease [Desulfatirhabdiaceae bacterium]
MADIVSKEQRSINMAKIRNRNTGLEICIRKELFSRGYRYRLNVGKLPGRPDIVLARFRAAIFVNGCFWHGHNCPLFRMPKSNSDFWGKKITANQKNDRLKLAMLNSAGWRTLTIWECAIRGKSPETINCVVDDIIGWLHSTNRNSEIRDSGSGQTDKPTEKPILV